MVSYRERIEKELLLEWGGFREALLKAERCSFDSMVSHSLKYVRGAETCRERRGFDLLVMSSQLSHEERPRALEEVLRTRLKLGNRFRKFVEPEARSMLMKTAGNLAISFELSILLVFMFT